MSQSEKALYYNALKDAGVPFSKHYREYNTAELKEAYEQLASAQALPPTPPPPAAASPVDDDDPTAAWEAMMHGRPAPQPEPEIPVLTREQSMAQHPSVPQPRVAPAAARNPNEMAGQRLNTTEEDEPIRVDPDTGFVWYQEEVLKPGYAKPRARRVLQYQDPGSKVQTVKSGDFIESFEVAGDGEPRTAEVKITLPSYQVGIYRDPRLPFKVHVYNGVTGFDLFEVQNFYGGADLVPAEVKRMYVENVLCYDIRTTVRAIQDEYRQLQLTGKVK